MTVIAALIVRNEATEIEACLDALRGLDGIAIVDTGSYDATPALVEAWAAAHPEMPVRTGSFRWIDDFAAARNAAAELAEEMGADWVVAIDADMRLPEGAADRLRAALASTQGRTLALTQVAMTGGWRNRRVLCHRPGVRWSGAIHEAIEVDDGETAADVEVLYGWSASHYYDRERNLRILRREAEENPTPRTWYYLGAELWDHGRLDEAIEPFTRCVESSQWPSERADAYLYLAKIAWRQRRGDEAREHCLRSLINVPDCAEALLLMAEMSWPRQAAAWRRYAAVATNDGVIFVRSPRPPFSGDSGENAA